MAGYEATIWLGVMAPGTPNDASTSSTGRSTRCINRPEVNEAWAKQGAVPMDMTPADFDMYLADVEKWAKVVTVSGQGPRGR